jgi:hypothetical protein
MEERFGVCPAEPWKKRGFGKRFGRDLGCFFEEFLHIVFSKMAMSAIIDFLNHRHWLCLAHSHHSHLHSLAKLPFVLLNMKAKQTQGFADCACKIVVKIMLKRHTKKNSQKTLSEIQKLRFKYSEEQQEKEEEEQQQQQQAHDKGYVFERDL